MAEKFELILSLETGTGDGSITLIRGGLLLAEFTRGVSRADALLPSISKLMQQVEVNPSQLSKLAVANGPGSFTGLRIGIATALGLGRSLGIEVTGISSLEALARAAAETEITSIIALGRDRFGVQSFYNDEQGFRPVSLPSSMRSDEIVGAINSNPIKRYVFAGSSDDQRKLVEAIENQPNVRIARQSLASIIGICATHTETSGPVPIYLEK
jgi:tRNA threonylcarbamoyl adenosine modification protein YeaZ